nr:reverse transcriptase domain-containing protein [Tanacetum cinerariifolium]
MKAVTTRSGLAYEGPSIPTESPLEKVDEQNTEEILDKEHSNSSGSTAQVQPLAVPIKFRNPMYRGLSQNLQFHTHLVPKFASTIKSLLANKDKLFELAKVPLNENCSAMLLKKLPEKLGDPGKFLIPCDFPGMEVCRALVDLGASINLMPLSIWKKLSLPELTPTRMTLKLADRSITHPKGVAEDVFVKVGKFHFPIDFVVVDFKADPRVPLILGRSFLRIGRALINVYGEEITLRVNDESITFNLNQTMRYSSTYDDTSVNRVDVIDVALSDSSKVPIVKSSSPTLTPFGESDFFLEETKDFLNDDSIPTGIENSVYDPEGDILFLEKLLNKDPFQLPSMDLKLAEESKEKSFVEEPPELELKELPSHLEYAFLEDSNKLSKIFDIKGIDPRFCTHKVLMEDDYKPAVQSQRRMNRKIHDVINKEFIKLLDADMIYPISDSLWVSPIHCVPKKGGVTVVANENNELIPMRLVTGWRVCIDYRKLNDATRKDHFPLPFMDQMLERLAENELYCFLDEVDRAKVDVIAKLPHLTIVKGVRSFLGHAGFYRRFIQDFSNFARPMTHLLEKETHFIFSKECIEAFNTLKKKLTEASILVAPDWNLPFELMCDASDYAIGAVAKPRLLRWVLLLQEFDITILDKKGSENLADDHLSRLENPHQDVLENKYINENFPLEALGSLTSNSTPWFTDIVNFRAGNFIKKGLTSQKKKKISKMKLLKFSKLAMRDLSRAIMVPISQRIRGREKYLREMKYLRTVSKFMRYSIFETAGDHRKLQLNELSELRDQAYENSVIYKERTKKLHDSKIKNRIFNVGDQVLLFNSRLKIFSGKLKTRWSGPFTIPRVFPYGTIELSQPNGLNFKVNGHRVKHYFGGDIPSNVALDLHTFPMDN